MNFMNGRYGLLDLLNKVLLGFALIFGLFRKTRIFGYIIIVYIFYRMLSKNIYARQQEEIKFEEFVRNISAKFNGNSATYKVYKEPLTKRISNWFNEKKNYKVFKCPNCSQKLRVPRGKGKIVITCAKCGEQFKAKS